MASQPLRGGPACRHRECQRQPGAFHPCRQSAGQGRKDRQKRRKTKNRRQSQPTEPVRLNLKTFGDPEKPGHELTEAEEVSQPERDETGCATHQHCQQSKGDQRKWQDRVWLQSQDEKDTCHDGGPQTGPALDRLPARELVCA